MVDRSPPDRSSVRELAKRIGERSAPPVKMTGSSTPGGRDRDTRHTGLPLPIGTVGQVVTVVDVSGNLIAKWADAAGASIGQYRLSVVVANSEGGFQIVNDGLGNPTYVLQDLE